MGRCRSPSSSSLVPGPHHPGIGVTTAALRLQGLKQDGRLLRAAWHALLGTPIVMLVTVALLLTLLCGLDQVCEVVNHGHQLRVETLVQLQLRACHRHCG